jgi:glutamine synthetase
MKKAKLEYVWLDGYKPTQSLRSKTKIVKDFDGTLESCPVWSFDGSSTGQAEGNSSDCLLKPVAVFPDPNRKNGYLVMTEVLNPDGTPHEIVIKDAIPTADEYRLPVKF